MSLAVTGRRPADGEGRPAARPPFALKLLVVGVLLYLAFGKGFAYAGWPPVFVGEILLVVVLVAALRSGGALPANGAALLTVGLASLAAVQLADDRLAGTVPLVETIRGLAPVYYSGYAFAAFALLRAYERRAGRPHVVAATEQALGRAAAPVLAVVLLLAVLLLVTPASLPAWPGSGVPILLTKSGDIAVTLTLLAPVLLARLHQAALSLASRRALLVMWLVTALLVSFRSRGALLALLVGLLVARPDPVRLAKGVMAVATVVLLLYVSGLRIEVGGREVSYEALGDAVASVTGGAPEEQVGGNYLDTTNWRADWWASIWDDVGSEQMVLHGRGWGDNLAVRHGVIGSVAPDDPRALRLPHDIFFSLAGRAGLLMAVGFLLVPVLTLARTYRSGPQPVAVEAARGALAAAVTTGLTDIYLESPQGGIVFWSLTGFLWWATAPSLSSTPTTDSVVSSTRRSRSGVVT